MIEKRYQVFVSSTYSDLTNERQEIMQALLELDCIPSGMELFPAANDDQWTLIRKVIEDCDYYIVVIGGKYGSIGPAGISYTEMEYKHALALGKPIIAFIHKDTSKLTADRIEVDTERRAKLEDFKALAKKKLVRFWETPADLGSVVSRSLVQLIKNNPAVGWVKASNVPDESAAQEILRLRKEIDRLESESAQRGSIRSEVISQLSQGDDKVSLQSTILFRDIDGYSRKRVKWSTALSWNEIFAAAAPSMIDEASRDAIERRISTLIAEKDMERINNHHFFDGREVLQIDATEASFDTIIVQMVALGVIEKSTRNRSVKDTATYWRLTPHGEKLMYELRAIRRPDLFGLQNSDTNEMSSTDILEPSEPEEDALPA